MAAFTHRRRPRPRRSDLGRTFLVCLIVALRAAGSPPPQTVTEDENDHRHPEFVEWEDGPSSRDEFDHANDPSICGVKFLSVAEWEAGRYWEKNLPVMVRNVTAEWAALTNWKKQEMIRRYPDAEATMGEAKLVGETGPDDAGKVLSPTTVKEFITEHMYNPMKYFFDRKIAIPKGMLVDCHPFPMPTRAYLANPSAGEKYAPAKKRKVRTTPDRELWRDHLAISIGADLQGLTFHHHREAWNVVLFGAKRWILWDHARWKNADDDMQWKLTRDWVNHTHVTGAEWIRRLYPEPDRLAEIRNHGHDCIQREGDMMFVPHRWMHMVVNIGDTVSVISEVGLGGGNGLMEEDFLADPPNARPPDAILDELENPPKARPPNARPDERGNDPQEEESSDDGSRDYYWSGDSEDSSQDYWSGDSEDSSQNYWSVDSEDWREEEESDDGQ